MPAFSLSIRRYVTNEVGCWTRFTFSGGWAEIAMHQTVWVLLLTLTGLTAATAGIEFLAFDPLPLS